MKLNGLDNSSASSVNKMWVYQFCGESLISSKIYFSSFLENNLSFSGRHIAKRWFGIQINVFGLLVIAIMFYNVILNS